MRPLIAAAVLASLVGYFLFGQNAGGQDVTPAARLKAVKKRFEQEVEELNERLQAARTPAEEKGVRAEARETATITLGKVLKVVEDHPKDPVVVEAAKYALGTLAGIGADGPDLEKLIGVVADHHLADPQAKDLVILAARVGPAGEKLLLAAADRSPDKTVRAVGLFALGQVTGERADATADDAQAAALYAKAVEFFQKAAKTAPDLSMGEETLAAVVADEVITLQKLTVGKPAPEAEGVDLDGKKVRLADYKGKVVLLDFWATWCGPCRAMIPHSRELVEKYKGKPFVLVGVNGDEERETLLKFKQREPMPWVHWHDGEAGPVGKAFRKKVNPTLYLIDAKGVIRKRWLGIPGNDPNSPVIEQAVDKLLKEIG